MEEGYVVEDDLGAFDAKFGVARDLVEGSGYVVEEMAEGIEDTRGGGAAKAHSEL